MLGSAMGPRLENPPENTCFACGPANDRGLRVEWTLERDEQGEYIQALYTPNEHEIGWPGLLHTGLHYTLMFDASYWAALTFAGKLHAPAGPQTFEQLRLPRTGKAFRVTARLASLAPVTTRSETFTHDGRPAASLLATWRPQTRSSIERAGLKFPTYILEHMDP